MNEKHNVTQKKITGHYGSLPYWVYASFFLGTFCSIASVTWSVIKTPEIPPTEEVPGRKAGRFLFQFVS